MIRGTSYRPARECPAPFPARNTVYGSASFLAEEFVVNGRVGVAQDRRQQPLGIAGDVRTPSAGVSVRASMAPCCLRLTA